MALGQNVLVAFMSWSGANYEDAIIISERLVKDSKFTTFIFDELEVSFVIQSLGLKSRLLIFQT
jgi:DNA-directed RNA polymerase subunit beta